MEMVKSEGLLAPLEGAANLPVLRQLGVMVGLAAAIAIGAAIFMWSQEPNYGVLYGGLAEKDSSQVMEALQQQGIKFKLDENTGAILVPNSKIHEIRIKLANAGLPKGSSVGFDILQKKQEFGTSQFLETARYHHALEGELARSIMSMNPVESARVHLAMPKQTSFVRKRQKPSASVLVNLYPGRVLEQEQVAAIAHLVAAGIPSLEPDDVTVVDEKGKLLSNKKRSTEMAINQEQFEYVQKVENLYIERIENILEPVVGYNRVRAQVSADLDFSVTEQTQESYNPDLPALRSEQTFEESMNGAGADGIPGALSNQPPAEAMVPEQAAAAGTEGEAQRPQKSRRRATLNYELDRTISHTKLASGDIQRLSVAVVVDHRTVVNDAGERVTEAWPEAEIERIRELVKEAVGYNAQRGDTINIMNAAFSAPEALEPLPEPPIWEQPWVWDLAKQGVGGIFILLLIFGVLRPLMKNLATVKPPVEVKAEVEGEGQGALPGAAGAPQLTPPTATYEDNLNMVKQMAQQDPKHVAQVVKSWVESDA